MNKIYSKLSEFSDIEKYIKLIKNKFSNFLNAPVIDYYNFIIENVIQKYSNFVEEIINNSLNNYISEPIELIKKMQLIGNDTDNKSEEENEKFKILINKKMEDILKDIIIKINDTLNNEIIFINKNIKIDFNSRNQINILDEFYLKCENLKIELTNELNYITSLNFSLNLKNIIKEKLENINSELNKIIENLQQKYYYLFCYENNILNTSCPNTKINKMNDFEKYTFQISKFKGIFNYLTLYQSYIDNIINEDNLNNLKVENLKILKILM